MPELPEVEIVCRNLNEIIGKKNKINAWLFFRPDLRFKIPKSNLNKLIGGKILNVSRRAKYILFSLNDITIISHLGMTGSWRAENTGWALKKHDHLAFEYTKNKFLVFNDPRRFGFIECIKNKDLPERFKDLGLEPLSAEADFLKLTSKFKKLNSAIKPSLMNQKLVVGIGNIYASEILFRTEINPLKLCSIVSSKNYEKIWNEARLVLKTAIELGGSSIENYKNSYGEKGRFQNSFYVYGRAGEPCLKCKTLIKTVVQSGRSTFWCPECQKK